MVIVTSVPTMNDLDNSEAPSIDIQEKSASSLPGNMTNDIDDENRGMDEKEDNKQSDSDADGDGNSDADSSEDDSDSDSDSDSDESDKPSDGISAYERLRIERIRRNEERLKQLGLVDTNKKIQPPKRKKRFSFGGAQKSKENEGPTRSQPRRSAKKKMVHGELLSGGKFDLRTQRQSYNGRFGRQKKAKVKPEKDPYSKRYRCGECRACTRQNDCQTCVYCSFNQRQGSSSTCRRRCLFKMCLRRVVDVEVEVETKPEENAKETTKAELSTTEATANAAAGDVEETTDKDGNADGIQNDKIEAEAKAEENTKNTTEAETETSTTEATANAAGFGKAIEKGGDANDVEEDNSSGGVGEENSPGTQEVETKVEAEADGDDACREQTQQPPKPNAVDESSAKASEEIGESSKTEETIEIHEKIPIENSEYFSSYKMEKGESGMPKWLEEFYEFMTTVPHGPWERPSGQRNADSVMSQVCKLVSGEGVTYHLWPEGMYFYRGVEVHLGMDLTALHGEAVIQERTYVDRRKGSLLRHPIAKLICYKEWIADGKPKPKEPPMSPPMALPPPTIDRSDTKKESNSDSNSEKKIVAMTIEERIKPNRIKWATDNVEVSANAGVEETNTANKKAELALNKDNGSDATNKLVEDINEENDSKSTIGCKIESNVSTDEKNNGDDAIESGDTTKSAVDTKTETTVSQGDDKENQTEFLSNRNETKKLNDGDKDITAAATNEANSIDVTAAKASADTSAITMKEADTKAEAAMKESSNGAAATKGDVTSTIPSSCAVCSVDGDLIVCDGCNRGYHSNCHLPKIKEIPIGDWFCKDCTRKKKQSQKLPRRPKSFGGPKREVVVNHKLFQGEHDDDCYMCYLGGELICCDFCEKSFHLACHIPPLPFVPEGIWKCCECSALERKKKSRCGECKACTRDECGKCKHCLDKPKFGGFNKLKQVCIKKVCPYPRFAPPASLVSVAGAITGKAPSNNTASICTPALGPNPIPSTGKKRGRPRKSVSGSIATAAPITAKSPMNNATPILMPNPIPSTGKKRGRPRKSVSGDSLPVNGSEKKRGRGRPRKSLENENDVPTNERDEKNSRPRKSVDGEIIAINSVTTTKRKRGRPRKSVNNDEIHESKRLKIEVGDEELIHKPIVFRFKVSSFKSAYKDPESVKIRMIIKTALRDPSDSKAVDKACEHLRKRMKSVESVKTAILFGGVEMLCNAMRDHPDKCILQAEACCTLSEMLWVFPGISKKLVHMGAINLIITSINNCPNNFKVQQMGCGALGAFSYDANITEHIMDAGGLQAVLAAMERFPKKVEVQMEGCYFFQNLIVRSIDALKAVSNSQVVPMIVETMSNANLETEILLSMCGLISNMAVNGEAKDSIGRSDAIPAVISVMNTTDKVEVQQAACTVLKNLAVGSSENQTKIAEKGGLNAIFGAIRSHPNESTLIVLSFNVMKELCINDEEVAYEIVKNGGIKIILKAMEKNRDLAAMQVAACEIIGYLLLEGKSEIQAPKLVKAIVTAMKNHSEASDVQIQACDALFELSQVPTTRLILKKKETQELLLRAKSHFKSCESDVNDIIAASKK